MLTGKAKRYLRSLAMQEEPIFQIGKGGLNDTIVRELSDAMEARELIKVRVLNNCEATPQKLAAEITAKTGAFLVQIIGHNMVFFRPSSKKPRIQLP